MASGDAHGAHRSQILCRGAKWATFGSSTRRSPSATGSYPGGGRPIDSLRTAVYRSVGPQVPITEHVVVNAKGTLLDVLLLGGR